MKRSKSSVKGYTLGLSFFKRFYHILSIIFPSCCSRQIILFVLLLLVTIGEQIVVYFVGLIPSNFYHVLPAKDIAGFWDTFVQSFMYIVLVALVKSSRQYIADILYVHWRDALTSYMHKFYFSNTNYYQINVLGFGGIDNPDQRITQDVERLCRQLSKIISVLIVSPFTIAVYTYFCYASIGYIGPLVIYIYFIMGTIINRFIMAPVINLTYNQEKLEGAFRFKHVQIRSNAESAAFFTAGKAEKDKADRKLSRLLDTQIALVNYEFWLHVAVNLFDYFGSILSYLVVAIPIFAGVYDDADIASVISKVSFQCMYLINCFSQLIDLSNQITDIAGYSHRIGELLECLKILPNKEGPAMMTSSDLPVYDPGEVVFSDTQNLIDNLNVNEDVEQVSLSSCSSTGAFQLEDVTIGTPFKEEVLIQDLNLEISQGKNLLIMGATGSGKTSLLRVLHGLWPSHCGTVRRYVSVPRHDVMFVPQKPFLSDGTLREQLTYPTTKSVRSSATDDARLKNILELVGLKHIYNRTGGLDETVEWAWHDVLTPGETQCLSFARLLYSQPCIAVLDEATSALSTTQEEKLYQLCITQGMTLVSVGHREQLRRFHDTLLTLSGNGRWQIDDIPQDSTDC